MINSFIVNVKRAETPFYANLKSTIKAIHRMSIPSIKPIHRPLYYLHTSIASFFKRMYHGVWIVPLVRSVCHQCGDNLRIDNGMPCIDSHLKIILGNNVSLSQNTILGSLKYYDDPTLTIGNNSTIGYETTISCSQGITIGDNVMISTNCFIADGSGHPLDPEKRKNHLPMSKKELGLVTIEDNVWIGVNCVILKGVTIGENSIIAANSVVTKSLPPNTMYSGNPEKVIKNYPRFLRLSS